MSYFAFGLVELRTGPSGRPETHAASALRTMERCAGAFGLAVSVDVEREPSLLADMRGLFSVDAGIPFLCLARAEDNTSEGLIAPRLLGVEGACAGATTIARWAGCVVQEMSVVRLLVWFTEGFDNAFERHDCDVGEAVDLLTARIHQENDVPSMLLSIRKS